MYQVVSLFTFLDDELCSMEVFATLLVLNDDILFEKNAIVFFPWIIWVSVS